MGSSVDVDDGVDWVSSLFCFVYLEDDSGCLWDGDSVEVGSV